jgi:uncharacterized protein YciI
MILVLLDYKVSPQAILDLRPAHLDWLRAGMADGRLIAAGRKVPVTGGMFMARGSLGEVRDWIATDPFAIAGAAEYTLEEIEVTLTAPGLEPLAS